MTRHLRVSSETSLLSTVGEAPLWSVSIPSASEGASGRIHTLLVPMYPSGIPSGSPAKSSLIVPLAGLPSAPIPRPAGSFDPAKDTLDAADVPLRLFFGRVTGSLSIVGVALLTERAARETKWG